MDCWYRCPNSCIHAWRACVYLWLRPETRANMEPGADQSSQALPENNPGYLYLLSPQQERKFRTFHWRGFPGSYPASSSLACTTARQLRFQHFPVSTGRLRSYLHPAPFSSFSYENISEMLSDQMEPAALLRFRVTLSCSVEEEIK